MEITKEQVEVAWREAVGTHLARSTRRIFFTFCNDPMEDIGHYKMDLLSGMGTGVLLYFDGKYFILTARHVLNGVVGDFQQNESPFFVLFDNERKDKYFRYEEMLFPKIMWSIGDIVEDDGFWVSKRDVVLIELFSPLRFFSRPDCFVDLNEVKVLPVSEIYEGQCLHVNGFPFVKNNFDYEFTSNNEDFDHATNIVRHHIVGCCVVAEGSNEPRIRFDLTCGYPGHEEVNGMSGGLVLNVPCLGGTQYWVGMAVQVDEKNECLDFIPAASLIDAIKNYKKSTPKVIDPAAYLESEWSDAWLSAEGRQANLGM